MLCTLPLAALALATPAAAAEIWTVDQPGQGDFNTIQAAVDAAANGDTILVRADTSGVVEIAGKSLVLQGEGAPVLWNNWFDIVGEGAAVRVRDLGPGQSVAWRGIALRGSPGIATSISAPLLEVRDCQGAVLVEDVSFEGNGRPVFIESCSSVTLVGTTTEPFPSAGPGSQAGPGGGLPGIRAISSTLFLHDCVVRGSDGFDTLSIGLGVVGPADGGSAISLKDTDLVAVGSQFLAGDGGSSTSPSNCYPGGNGGKGLVVVNGSTARLLDSVAMAGVGGAGSCGLADGNDGSASVVNGGSQLDVVAGDARKYQTNSPATEQGTLDLTFTGQPGDLVLLAFSGAFEPGLFIAPLGVALHVQPPFALQALGTIPANGSLGIPFSLPSLPPGVEHLTLATQAVLFDGVAVYDAGPRFVLVKGQGL